METTTNRTAPRNLDIVGPKKECEKQRIEKMIGTTGLAAFWKLFVAYNVKSENKGFLLCVTDDTLQVMPITMPALGKPRKSAGAA